MEIIQERLEREFQISLVTTSPNVRYILKLNSGEKREVDTPANMPLQGDIEDIYEPIVSAEILTPKEYIGGIMTLCQKKRGIYKTTHYLSTGKAQLLYELPLGEIIFDFFSNPPMILSTASKKSDFPTFFLSFLKNLQFLKETRLVYHWPHQL